MMLQPKKDSRLEPGTGRPGVQDVLFLSRPRSWFPAQTDELQRRDTAANIAAHAHAHVGGVTAPQPAAAACPDSFSQSHQAAESPTSRGDIAERTRPHLQDFQDLGSHTP